MKRMYVSLDVKVVDVQLSDCIAGSAGNIVVEEGSVINSETSDVEFGTW